MKGGGSSEDKAVIGIFNNAKASSARRFECKFFVNDTSPEPGGKGLFYVRICGYRATDRPDIYIFIFVIFAIDKLFYVWYNENVLL